MVIEQKYKWQLIFVTVLLVGVGLLCFFLGRSTVKNQKPEVIVEYVQGPTIHDTIKYPQPYAVIKPVDTLGIIQQCIRDGIYSELFPTKVITKYIEVTREDTTGIMEDWATKRKYTETIFDVDTLGRCVVNADVQYNRMVLVGYEYTPVIKTVKETNYIVRKFSPFIGVGAMVNPWDNTKAPMANATVGFFVKEKYGLQLQYQHAFNLNCNFLGGNILYKF
jgi:hypothetical protein